MSETSALDSAGYGPSRGLPKAWLVVIVALLLTCAGATRLCRIGSEPLWLDEVFSHDFTSGSVTDTVRAAALDVHPPLYFLALRSWRKVVGDSPAAERSLSAAWSILGLITLLLLVRELGVTWPGALATAVLVTVSPLDVYFAQEARMYAQAAALGVLSTWLLVRWLRRRAARARAWPWLVAYVIAAVALLGSHYVTVALLLAQGVLALFLLVRRRDLQGSVAYLSAALACATAFLPWIIYVTDLRGSLYSADRVGWIPVPTFRDCWLLLTHDLPWGRPGFGATGWGIAAAAATAGWLFLGLRLLRGDCRRQPEGARSPLPGPTAPATLVWMLAVPVVVAAAVSVLWRPVLYFPRFGVLVLPYFLALAGVACVRSRRRWARVVPLVVVATAMASATVAQSLAPQKTGLAGFAALWRAQGPPDYVLFYPRWNRRVAGYYLGEPVWNVPRREELESALHGNRPLRVWICTRHGRPPDAASGEQAEYEWALSLGPHHQLARVDRVEDVIEVTAQPLPKAFPLLPESGRIDFASPSADPYLWSGWYPAEKEFRWSRGTRAEVVFGIDEGRPQRIKLRFSCFGQQKVGVDLNRERIQDFQCTQWAPQTREIRLPSGALAHENSLVFRLPDAASPSEVGRGRDSRQLAIAVYSVTVLE